MKQTGGVVIVGPCAAGKSSLASRLQDEGWQARQIAQEHSHVPSMWRQLSQPDVLIFLNASFEACTQRKSLNWNRDEYEEQQRRLSHAREHSDLYLETDDLNPGEVAQRALEYLGGRQSKEQTV